MQNTLVLIPILVFTFISLLTFGGYYLVNQRRKHQELVDKIKKGSGTMTVSMSAAGSANSDNTGSLKKFFLDMISDAGELIKPKNEADINDLHLDLVRAGYRKRNSYLIFYGAKVVFALSMLFLFFMLKTLILDKVSLNLMTFIIIGAASGFYIPNIWLRIMTDRRKNRILEGFPDALDLMIVCIEAGMGLDAAIARVSEEMKLDNKVVSEEFRLVSLELRAGKLRSDALRNLAKRIDLEEVSSLISLLIQTDKFGTSVAQALRVHSDTMRTSRYQRADELAAKLPVKLVFPLIVFIFPSLFVVLIGPAAIRIVRTLLPALGGQ